MVSDTFCGDKSAEGLLKQAQSTGVECYQLPDTLFGSVSDTRTPQGILAVLKLERKRLEDANPDGGLLVMLDNIKDPGNMGTIIRTADAAGCSGVIVPDGCVDVYNPKVLRSTMGSIFHIPVYHCGNISEAILRIRNGGYKVFASHLEGAASIYETDLRGPVALVIGSEAEGVGKATVRAADALVKIPMEGRAESLNASIAAGVMIFEAMRQRTCNGK